MTGVSPALLIIDDEKPFVEFLANYFNLRGFRVTSANDGTTGLALAGQHRPDVVLVDYRMPGMRGDAVLKEFNTRMPDVKVIMILASEGYGQNRLELARMGAYACFDKPLESIKELESKVREAASA